MRVISSMISKTFIGDLNNNLAKLSKLQEQSATNRTMIRISDDPVALISALQVRERLGDIEQYSENLVRAQGWLTQTESSLMEIDSVIDSAYELCVKASSDTVTPSDREMIATEIKQLRDQLINTGNSKMSSQYVFGGYNTTVMPFEVDASGDIFYNGVDMVNGSAAQLATLKTEALEYELGSGGLKMDVAFSGAEVFGTGDENLYKIFDDLYNDLMSGQTGAEIDDYVTKLEDKREDILGLVSVVGARSSRVTLLKERYAEDTLNYQTMKTNIEDVDQAEIYLKYSASKAVYTSTLGMGAQIILPTLSDYL